MRPVAGGAAGVSLSLSAQIRSSFQSITFPRRVTFAVLGMLTVELLTSVIAGVSGRGYKRKTKGVKMAKGPAPIPVNPADVFKLADRLISAYERSCELEVEKERINAELELGIRKIELEEKRLDVQYKAAVKILEVESKKLDAALKIVDQKVLLTKTMIEKCDSLMKCISVDKDEVRRGQMVQMWMSLHGGVTQQLGNTAEEMKVLLASGSQNLAGTAAKMLASRGGDSVAITYGGE